MTTENENDVWGEQAQPIQTSLPERFKHLETPFRDNSYITVWDGRQKAFITVHIMSTPNGDPLARVGVSVEGYSVDFMEPLIEAEGFIYRSEHIEFDVRGKVVINHPDLTFDGTMTPKFHRIIQSGQLLPEAGGPQTNHMDRTICIEGPCVLKGKKYYISAEGHRDRAIGFRDESQGWSEAFYLCATFEQRTVTAIRFISEDKKDDRIGGHVYNDEELKLVKTLRLTRDEAGLLHEARIGLEDGEEITVTSLGREESFWVPMGWKRHGPAFSDCQEFCKFRTDDGSEGYGQAEHGVMRYLY